LSKQRELFLKELPDHKPVDHRHHFYNLDKKLLSRVYFQLRNEWRVQRCRFEVVLDGVFLQLQRFAQRQFKAARFCVSKTRGGSCSFKLSAGAIC